MRRYARCFFHPGMADIQMEMDLLANSYFVPDKESFFLYSTITEELCHGHGKRTTKILRSGVHRLRGIDDPGGDACPQRAKWIRAGSHCLRTSGLDTPK
jgi:hypothetical protein